MAAYECHSIISGNQWWQSGGNISNLCPSPPSVNLSVMASRTRNENWKDDEELKEDLEKYIKQNLKRKEVLDFVSSKYPMYAWSLRTLCRRLSHFNIKYTNYEIELGDLRAAVEDEMQGPGKLLGYVLCTEKYEKSMALMYHGTWSMP